MTDGRVCTLKSTAGRWILLAAILASGAAFLAGSAVPVALPRIQSSFNTALSGIQWVVNAYLLALGALILLGGALGDQYGRKRVFVTGMAIFTAAALFSGFASSTGMLLGFQALMGAGAALLVPQSLAIINDCFVESERGRAIGLWAGISGALATIGPLAAGAVLNRFAWGGVFFMLTPVMFAALLVTLLFVPDKRPLEHRRLDWAGLATIVAGLFGLVYGLITGPNSGWNAPAVLASVIGGALLIVAFIIIELRRRQPLVYLNIFKSPLVTGANLATLFVYFGLSGVTFFIVLNLQQVQGYTPVQSGLALLPPFALITLLTWPAGALADRFGPTMQMIIGPAIVGAGMVLLALGGQDTNYTRHFLPGLTLLGLGMATLIPPLTKCALAVQPMYSGSASGINNGISRIAGLLAVAILGAMVVTLFHTRLAADLPQSGLTSTQQQAILEQAPKLGGIIIPDNFTPPARQAASDAIRSAFVFGFRRAMAVCAALAFGGALVSAILIRNNTKNIPGGAS
ncbi:MAG TPA: MFS transporter [Dehalococcoidales bacterium]|nr:MFS transporter [Dehalococcoidales bacterium]